MKLKLLITLALIAPGLAIAAPRSVKSVGIEPCPRVFESLDVRVADTLDGSMKTLAYRFNIDQKFFSELPASEQVSNKIYILLADDHLKDQNVAKNQFDLGVAESTMHIPYSKGLCGLDPSKASFPSSPKFLDNLKKVEEVMIGQWQNLDETYDPDLYLEWQWVEASYNVTQYYNTSVFASLGGKLRDGVGGFLNGILMIENAYAQSKYSDFNFDDFVDNVGSGASTGAVAGAGAGCAVGVACGIAASSTPATVAGTPVLIATGGTIGTAVGAGAGAAVGGVAGGGWYVARWAACNVKDAACSAAESVGEWVGSWFE